MKNIITTLLSSALVVALSSASVAAADLGVVTEPGRPSLLEAALAATEWGMKCMSVDDTNGMAWNGGKLCVAVDGKQGSKADGSVQSPPVTGGSGDSKGEDMLGAFCELAGGSTAAGNGFCLAANNQGRTGNVARFSVGNGLPFTGLQFLQILFRDGSKIVGTRPSGAACQAAGGIGAAIGSNGFCLAADLDTLRASFARFAAANELPAVGLLFVQITFAGDSPLGAAALMDNSPYGADASMGTNCTLAGGSNASSDAGGFCLASDLTTRWTASSANFSVANTLPVAGVQLLQITFRHGRPARGGSGAECVSNAGSTSSIGNSGSCQSSDHSSVHGNSNLAFANGLPVAGLQFFEATFGESTSPHGDRDAKCTAKDGSVASAGNPNGFCLVSVRGAREGLADFSVANDLPVSEYRFIQVPFGDGNPPGSKFPLYPRSYAPIGISMSDCLTPQGYQPANLPALALSAGSEPNSPNVSDQERGLREYLAADRRFYRSLAFSPGARSDLTPIQQKLCRQRTTRWGQLRF